jgi:hypothetical protein
MLRLSPFKVSYYDTPISSIKGEKYLNIYRKPFNIKPSGPFFTIFINIGIKDNMILINK